MRGSLYKLFNFDIMCRLDGNLVPLEGKKNIPFAIKRVYYIWGTGQNIIRGQHTHRKNKQIVICLSGSCDFILDDGKKKEKVHLSHPEQGLLLKPMVWHSFTNFSKDCVLMVLASEYYDEGDYINDYQEFLKEVTK